MRSREEVVQVKFFTSIVNEDRPGDDAKERHERYIRALKTLGKVKIICGKFQDHEVKCRADCRKPYFVPEEKKTDVNIAVEIMSDTFADGFDQLILVSGDSDAQPPIEWVRRNRPEKRLAVYIPALPREQASRRLDFYGQIGVDCRFLPLDRMAKHQLPAVVRLPGDKVVCRPHAWSVMPSILLTTCPRTGFVAAIRPLRAARRLLKGRVPVPCKSGVSCPFCNDD